MKPSVTMLLEEAQKKMSGYAALLNYRFINLSVKAQPEALLSVTVSADGTAVPLERVALARNAAGRDDRFEIFPKNRNLVGPVVAGLKLAHPEYTMELKDISGTEDAEGVKDKYILVTMPEVSDGRNSELSAAMDKLSGKCDDLLKLTLSHYSDRIKLALEGASSEDQEEAQNALQDLYEKHDALCKLFRADKDQEVEEAHNRYEDKQAGQKAESDAAKAAADEARAALQMILNQK